MKEASIISRLRSALHDRFDPVAKEPLPTRWGELINVLNERERFETEARERERRKSEKIRH